MKKLLPDSLPHLPAGSTAAVRHSSMNLWITVGVGFREIWAHKFRSFLTMLGVILGVASLFSMFALTAGMARGMRETLAAMGGIERVGIVDKDVPEPQQGIAEISPGRTLADVRALRAAAPLVSHVTPEAIVHGAAVTAGGDSLAVLLEPPKRWWVSAAVDRTLYRQSLLLLGEVAVLGPAFEPGTEVTAAAGLRWQWTPSLVLDAGVARRLTTAGPDVALTASLDWTFSAGGGPRRSR